MKYQKPRMVLQSDALAFIQAGVKNQFLFFDLVFLGSTTAYEADE